MNKKALSAGLFAIVLFSFTVPLTRYGVTYFDPYFFAVARILLAALAAAIVLLCCNPDLPAGFSWRQLLPVTLGVGCCFPLALAWAMVSLPATHAAIMLALMPLLTALMAVLTGGETLTLKFWFNALLSVLVVFVFVIIFSPKDSSSEFSSASLLLLLAMFGGAWGYAKGAVLARSMPSWQVICLALVLSAPLLGFMAVLYLPPPTQPVPVQAWLALAYSGLVSQLLGFLPWYYALSRGGIASVGQLQLLQPLMTLVAASVILGESLTLAVWFFAIVILVLVYRSQRLLYAQQLVTKAG